MTRKKGNVKMYSPQTADFILAAAIIILSALPVLSDGFFSRGMGTEADVYKENKLLYRLPLDKDMEIAVGKMKIAVKQGRVAVLESDCPHLICVQKGWISKSPEKIICIPNKVIVEVKSAANEQGVDIISY